PGRVRRLRSAPGGADGGSHGASARRAGALAEMLGVLDDFLWVLRREGYAISTPQAIDAARAASAVGFDDRTVLREAVACVVVDSIERRTHFDRAFDAFFSSRATRPVPLGTRLLSQGFTRRELSALADLLRRLQDFPGERSLRVLLEGGSRLDHLLA